MRFAKEVVVDSYAYVHAIDNFGIGVAVVHLSRSRKSNTFLVLTFCAIIHLCCKKYFTSLSP